MTKIFKPLLAARIERPELVRFPVLASPKLDGVRAVCVPGRGLVSRKLLQIPNAYVQRTLLDLSFSGLDGELVVGSATDPDVYNRTQSGVMSVGGEPDFTFNVFDCMVSPSSEFRSRLEDTAMLALKSVIPQVRFVNHTRLNSWDEVDEYEEEHVRQGYEGVMLRSLTGEYKFGRSTEIQGILLKVKRFEDDEAIVTGWEPLERNRNVAKVNELGNTKRSSHKENMEVVPDLVGRLNLVGAPGSRWEGVSFGCGSGMDTEARRRFARDASLVGSIVTYKYQPAGSKDRPRGAIFKGVRRD